MVMILIKIYSKGKSFRKQAIVISIGVGFPLLWVIFGHYLILSERTLPIKINQFGFAVTAVTFTWGIFYRRFLDIAPIALRLVFENMRDMIFVINNEHRVMDINLATRISFSNNTLPSRYKNVIGRRTTEIFSSIPDLNSFIIQNEHGKKSIEISDHRNKLYYNISIDPILNKEKECVGKVLSMADITDLQNQKEKLQEQKEELKITLENLKTTQSQLIQSEKMASLGQLVAGIAHEINNPVTFISAGVDSLNINIEEVQQVLDIYQGITPDNVKEKLTEIKKLKEKIEYKETISEINKLIDSVRSGSERTTEIVKGLRTFSRLDEDVLKYVNIHEGLDSTLILMRNKYKERIEIENLYGDIPEIECYPGQLNQVFMNVLSNAIDAIDDKGTITIITSKSNETVRISIKDTGRGIPEENQSRIFEPFFTTKEVGKGTGLGLSICHSIINRHSGSIEVKSEVGKGSEFVIVLPMTQFKR
jgi:signal transduction histidine kinase